MQPSEDRIWYVAQIKPNGEELAEQNLRRQGFEVFSPKIAQTRRYKGRFREELRSLFPGYLFVRVSSRMARWRAIGSTLGVRRLVSFGSHAPSSISGEVIALLKQRCDRAATEGQNPLREGDGVRIVSGPFANFVASIESIPSERRIWVLLDVMGHGRRISMARLNVEREAS